MRSVKLFGLITLLAAAALASAAFINGDRLKKVNPGSKGFAVVELFTSEGCSSCPPADELVAKIEKENKDNPVYILAFHVDYWNRLGWKDQFSDAGFSKRQSEYARYLKLDGVYTPQIVVNGQTEFVGSQEGTLRNAIRTCLQKTPASRLELIVTNFDQKHADLNYIVGGADKNTVLQVVVLEKAATSKVGGGENSGKTLAHVQIVRKLQQAVLNTNNGTVSVALPNGFDVKNWEITGFLQNRLSGAVTGAARATLPNAAAAVIKGAQ